MSDAGGGELSERIANDHITATITAAVNMRTQVRVLMGLKGQWGQ